MILLAAMINMPLMKMLTKLMAMEVVIGTTSVADEEAVEAFAVEKVSWFSFVYNVLNLFA